VNITWFNGSVCAPALQVDQVPQPVSDDFMQCSRYGASKYFFQGGCSEGLDVPVAFNSSILW
jgi:hypothetical protein